MTPEQRRAANCVAAKKWRLANPEKAKASRDKWMKANRAKLAAWSAAARRADPAKFAARRRAARLSNPGRDRFLRFGITPEAQAAMFEAQRGLCAICNLAAAGHMDHDHAHGRVRGLLCGNCNRGLGMFRDDPRRLQSAIEYLTRVAV